MKIIYVNQNIFTYFLIIFHASKAATHWIVTEDGKIHTQEDSMFQMRRPYDLMSFLQQEKRANVFAKIKSQLMAQKEEIESDNFDNQEDVEQVVYQTNDDCLKARKPLVQFDLYVGTMVFAYPKNDRNAFPAQFPTKMFHNHHQQLQQQQRPDGEMYLDATQKNWITLTSSNTSSKIGLKQSSKKPGDGPGVDSKLDEINFDNDHHRQPDKPSLNHGIQEHAPNCSAYPFSDFSMTSFEHLPSVRSRKTLKMEREPEILRYIGKWKSYRTFGKDIVGGLKQNSTSWILLTLASYYWRGMGNADQAIECVRRALHSSPYEYRSIPLLSLATILHRARSYEEAVIVLHGIIDMAPEIPHSHYTLANIYTVMTDYNRSIICLDNVLKLCPNFSEAKLRKHAILCHNSIENALKAQHENLQKTLDELKDYQRQQELWISYHQKLRSEQAPPSVQLEQRLHYREFKIRQKLENESFLKDGGKNPQTLVKVPDDVLSAATLNQIQMKLEEHGKKLFDLYIEMEEHEKAFEENQLKKRSLEANEELFERSNRIKKLLATTTGSGGGGGGGGSNNNELNDSSDQRTKHGEKTTAANKKKSSPVKATNPKTAKKDADNKNGNNNGKKESKNANNDEDESNKSENVQECSPNSRPMLIPVTLVLPPSN